MIKNIYRDCYAGSLREKDIDKEVKVAGFIENIRDHGGVIFVDLRDYYGTLQLVSNDDKMFDDLTRESSVTVTGKIRKRDSDDYNDRIETGTIELLVSSIKVLGKSKNVLPFEVMTSKDVSEDVRLKYRYLDLRNPKVKQSILFRNKVIHFLRNLMESEDFVELQTPILTSSSPEGARDFLVPSRKYKGKFYALPQAPQQFKQLLMCAGFDKYYQIAPCFRDEDARSDRVYGEFYQLDFEMAFSTEEDVLRMGEKVFYETFREFTKDRDISEPPFIRLTYKEAMEKYGSDKPDLRNPLVIIDLTEEFEETEFRPFRGVPVKGIKVENLASKSNSWFNEVVDYAKSIGMPGIGYLKVNEDLSFAGPIDKFLTEDEREALIDKVDLKKDDVLFFIADRKKSLELAGSIRMELGRKLDLMDPNKYVFAIIHDFPMFEWDEENECYTFMHNPFSMPKDGMKGLDQKVEDILAYQFDFVCNGVELSSGAVRNHDLEIMKKVFAIAGYEEEEIEKRFKALYEAFQYGAPPHAGMAPGLDRILMMLLDEDSIRETIAFPMSASGSDILMNAPSTVTEQQLREVHIKVRD
ncbi:aspartate--tRNA ligase 1 [Clostridium sp. CAG:451]|nr:aspartate--tRNA ligase 1 [Clostridium sp. CAG:451]